MTEDGGTAGVLDRVDFGRYDAESDPNLLDYFLVTGTAREAATGARLIVGRKGSGKTALFKHLAATLEGRVVALDLIDYVFGAHEALFEAGLKNNSFAYTSSWRLLILSAMYAEVHTDLGRSDRKTADDALRKIGLGPNRGPFKKIADWLKRVRKVDLPSVEGLASLGGFERDAPEEALLDTSTADALRILQDILAKACEKQPITVLLDRLDDAWDGSPESLDLITGAVRATRTLGIALRQSGPAPVITFLRTDLWEKLSFNDRNKMSQDLITLDWTPEQLVDVIERRVEKSADIAEGQGWSAVFTSAEMRQRASARTYITKRTIGRPRDIVAFSSFALREARTNGHDQIEGEDIYAAERRYSKHALDELRDEIGEHVADFSSVVNSIKSIGKRTFSAADWERAAAENGLGADDALVALEQLFEASAIGVHRAGGAAGGSRTTFRYQDRHLKSSDEALLQVHLAFVQELGLRDA